MQIRIVFCLVLFLLCCVASANAVSDKALILQKIAIEKELWQHKEWHNLVHYYKKSFFSDQYFSHADDKNFFFAKDGATNPRAELLATIAAFYRTNIFGDEHPQCRFVARFAWLKQRLSIDERFLPVVHCREYKSWHSTMQAQRVSIIFPTYYLNSPSSMFGHTLLRLDPSVDTEQSKLLSYAVNFAANTDAVDNSIFYAYKGITGAYPGLFSVVPYFKKIREYNRFEERDIWEYSLNLTPIEVERMVMHLWELRNINFDYYFFDENCSYRLLELLEVARPALKLRDLFGLTTAPIDTIKAIDQAGLIESSQYRPAQITELSALLNTISKKEQRLVKQIAVAPSRIEHPDFAKIPINMRRNVIDAAYRYLRYQQSGKAKNKIVSKHSFQLLKSLNALPRHSHKSNSLVPPVPPEQGHGSRQISTGLTERNNKLYSKLSFRAAFHSLEDNLKGFLAGAQINMANTELRMNKKPQQVELDRLDVIDIFSLNPRTDFFQSVSWRVFTGLERQFVNDEDRLVAHLSGGAGLTYSVAQKAVVYSFAITRIERGKETVAYILEPAVGIANGLLWHFKNSTARLELSAEQFLNGSYRSRMTYLHNFVLTRNQSIKLSFTEEKHSNMQFSTVSINYQYYFN